MAIKICLDAGHYGKYNRSPIVPSYYESDMNWKLHLKLKTVLERYGIEVIATRQNQATDRDLYGRGYASKGCDLFLSIHSNACNTESVDYPVAICLLDDKKYTFDDVSREIGAKLAKVVGEVMQTTQPGRTSTRQSGNDRDGNGILDDEYYGVLHGAKMAHTPGIIMEHSFHTNTRSTKWLSDDNNLQKLAEAEGKVIAEYFGMTEQKKEDQAQADNATLQNNDKKIWDFLILWIENEFGAAGLMGNLYAESHLFSNNLQNSYNEKLGMTDEQYTAAVDNGTYSQDNFVNDKAGYGLAQWTYWSRKQALMNYAKDTRKKSIGDLDMQLDFLKKEISDGYKSMLATLKAAKSVKEASDAVLTIYEAPENQNDAVKALRAQYGQTYYDAYKTAIQIGSNKLYRVQIGAYLFKANAESMKQKLQDAGFDAIIVESK